MVESTTGIAALPNEILLNILSTFPTRSLLPIAPTSHRFHDLILQILHTHLHSAASLQDHKLILECFHPSAKLSTPYLFCDYIGTSTLTSTPSVLPDPSESISLGKLNNLYSHFRPIKPDSDRRDLRPHPAGGWLALPPNSNALVNDEKSELVCQNIHLESHELFSQLCTITNLVKVGPKRGLFLSCVNIGEGIMRVWRDWLGKTSCEGVETGEDRQKRLLWADSGSHVGLRMRVKERDDVPPPVLVSRDEDPALSYTLQYEELVVRTSQLLLMVEQSIEQEVEHSGMLCGLDGEYMPEEHEWGDVPESMAEYWRAALEIYEGGTYGVDWIGYDEGY